MACHMSSTLLPVYWGQTGFHDWQFGWLAAGFSLAAILSRLKLGVGLERFGRKPFLLIGAILLTLPSGLYLRLGDSFALWWLLRFAQGLGLGIFITTVLTWVADRSPPEQVGKLQGVFGVSGLLGSALGPYFSEKIYLKFGFSAMFYALLAAGIVCCILISCLPESAKIEAQSPNKSMQSIKLSEHKAVIFVTLPFGWLVGTIIVFLAPFLVSLKLSKVGLYFAGFAAASVAVRIFAGRAIDEVPVNRLITGSGLLLGLSGFAIASLQWHTQTWLLIAGAVLNGLGHGFFFPGLSSHMVRNTSLEQRGAGLSLFTGVFDLGILLGSLLSGYISQSFGYSCAFLFAAIFLSSSLPFFSMYNPKQNIQPKNQIPI